MSALLMTVGAQAADNVELKATRGCNSLLSLTSSSASASRSMTLAVRQKDLSKETLTRSELEKSPAFLNRVHNLVAKKIGDPSNLIFLISLSSKYNPLSYDADAEVVRLAKYYTWSHQSAFSSFEELQISYWENVTGRYVGQNGFGVQRTVDVREANSIGINVSHEVALAIPQTYSISPKDVSQFKRSAVIVLEGSATEPYLAATTDHLPPTLDSPSSFTWTHYVVPFKTRCMAILSDVPSANRIVYDHADD